MCDCITTVNKKLSDAGIKGQISVPLILDDTVQESRTCVAMVHNSKPASHKLFASYCPFCGVKYK